MHFLKGTHLYFCLLKNKIKSEVKYRKKPNSAKIQNDFFFQFKVYHYINLFIATFRTQDQNRKMAD